MTQKLFLGTLGGTGIVAVLFIMGLILYTSGVDTSLGTFAISVAIFIAVIFGFLGIAGILKRLIPW